MYETQLNSISGKLDQAIWHASFTEKIEGNFDSCICVDSLSSCHANGLMDIDNFEVERAEDTRVAKGSYSTCSSQASSSLQPETTIACDQEYERPANFPSSSYLFSPRSIGSKVSDELSQCQTYENMDSPCYRDSLRNFLSSVKPAEEHDAFCMEPGCKCENAQFSFDDLFVLDEDSAGFQRLSDDGMRRRRFRLLDTQEQTKVEYVQTLDKQIETLILSRAAVTGKQRAIYDAHLCLNLQLLLADTKDALLVIDGLLNSVWYCEKCEAGLFAHKKWQPKPRLRQYMISRRKTVL
ncbi:hypothetical protein GUITHDRAFT_114834 [Guillardia theta CCMP2712]|uniref:Uncharacterized protein n=1 Tax=Guillardia theta (strain CCMP2712) TaxID=905079 RepID=L1ITL8_GUITC|nr:hypothetical protein GUITHDRAFT_114834 [Guillardia theta CCMP2712]EKX39180.1 hypothetical protein GUITHDRAFT_114834 [Guillardia theta CCMP2712]|eukprot:XP_005826160.1 hypothetical protein GUITHDRAFT_114834 [Guillardia theta CCMP2712]